MGEAESDKFRAAAQDAVLMAVGIPVADAAPGANELRGHSLVELARESLQREGLQANFGDNMELARQAINSTSTFPAIMSNLANKSVMTGFNEAETTFQIWAGKGSNRDFKEAARYALSEAGNLELVPEGSQFPQDVFGEASARTKVATYGKIFSLTRQAIINDDLGLFSKIATKYGSAAKRLVNKMVYAQLTGNVKMQDNIALFDTKHGNVAGTGEALSVKAIGVNSGVVNPYKGRFVVVADAELTDPDAWYLVADASQHDTIEVTYLNGVETPRLETRQGFDVDGIEYKVAFDVGVDAIDFRGLYKNAGK